MPTIRSRILKPNLLSLVEQLAIGLNANDPFEDTETRVRADCLVHEPCLNANDPFEDTETRWQNPSASVAEVGLNANDPFEDTETRWVKRSARRSTGSQCQRSVRGY